MKYKCQQCRFQWEGNTDTFSQVIEHERIHKEKQKKLKNIQKDEKIRISSRRKSQLGGKPLTKRLSKKRSHLPIEK